MNIHRGVCGRFFANIRATGSVHACRKTVTKLFVFGLVVLATGAFLKGFVMAGTSAVGDLAATLNFGDKYVSSDITEQIFELPVDNGAFATIKIDAEFANGQDKKIKVKVPTGIGIDGYSATEDTASIDGVNMLAIDDVYKSYVKTSSLTAATSDTHILDKDGNQVKFPSGTDWTNQVIDGYTGIESRVKREQRTHGGDIEWTFANSTSKIELTLSIYIDNEVLTHLSDTEQLEDIVISMESTTGTQAQHCKIIGTGLYNFSTSVAESARVDNIRALNILYQDTVEGMSEQFGVGFFINAVKFDAVEYALIDKLEYTYSYPEGVYYDNKVGIKIINKTITAKHYEDDQLFIDVNEGENGGGTINVVIKNLRGKRNNGKEMTAYFRADNSVYNRENKMVQGLSVDAKFSRNGYTKSSATISYTRTLVFPGSGRSMTVVGRNYTRRDINSDYPGFSYNDFIGGFRFSSEFAYTDVRMKFDFTDRMGVRAVTVPGKNIRDIVATTTLGRTIEISSINGVSSKGQGVMIDNYSLGLLDNEYLLDITALMDIPSQGSYSAGNYNSNACSYYGAFLNNETDTATLSIVDDNGNIETNASTNKPITGTDRTSLGWTKAGVYEVSSEVRDSDDDARTSFYPNQKMKVHSQIKGGIVASYTSATIIDPIVIISVPKGISLDTQSVVGTSVNGASSGATVKLMQSAATTTQNISDVAWTTYYYKAENPLDLISIEGPGFINRPYVSEYINVDFELIVENSAPQYNLDLADIVSFDVGAPAVRSNGSSHNPAYKDEANRAGKGTEYYLAAAKGNIQIKPLIGLNTDIGIRTKGFNQDFMTYDGTESSIATLSNGSVAEVKIHYESTGSSEYKAGSVIYMPVPKRGVDFAKYFENIEVENPMEVTNNATFEYSTKLASIPVLSGSDGASWDTYFAVDVVGSNSSDYTVGDRDWEPVESSTGTIAWVKASEYTGDLADVIMIKFVASSIVEPGSVGSCVYDLIINTASERELSATNYWRTYNKVVTRDDGTGIWSYSSIIAANANGVDLAGRIFVDQDQNAIYEESNDKEYTGGLYSVFLARNDNSEPLRELIVDQKGTFSNRAKDADGWTDFALKQGDYTLIVIRDENEKRYVYSDAESDIPSDINRYRNDVKNSSIDEDKVIVRQQFSVDLIDVSNNGYMHFIGIGLVDLEQRTDEQTEEEQTIFVPNTGNRENEKGGSDVVVCILSIVIGIFTFGSVIGVYKAIYRKKVY